MKLGELGKELEKDKRGYKNALIIEISDGMELYVSEIIIDNLNVFLICTDELENEFIKPCDVVKFHKKKYFDDLVVLVAYLDENLIRDVKSVSYKKGDGSFGEFEHKILNV